MSGIFSILTIHKTNLDLSRLKRGFMEAYKHCFYNKFNKTIYLRTTEDDHFRKIPYKKDYYVKDPTGNSPITDIHRNSSC